MESIALTPIGTLHSIYKEKFGIPRQPGLVDAPAWMDFYPAYAREEAVRGLEHFSHVWLLFNFHQSNIAPGQKDTQAKWLPMVRPPRLGGNKKVGVFASRSPCRPNGIGMSAVRLTSIEHTDKGPVLHLSGVDILDGTPILDIKPYLPYSDIVLNADDGFAHGASSETCRIVFASKAKRQIRKKERQIPRLASIITAILENDPRPAYRSGPSGKAEPDRVFGIRIFDFDLKWMVTDDQIIVLELAVCA
jgi:tRNA-Thr(GGU) m(6)t(6)A37 methyltransferase TsaA